MPIKRRRTTTGRSRKTPPIPLCTGCGYATIFPTNRLFNNFKAPKSINPSTPPGEVMQWDASVISEWLSKARCDLAEYTREVDRLRSRLVKLEGVRDGLQELIDYHAALVAPVARLPTEVLHMIFCLSCIPDDSEGPHHREQNVSLMYPAGRTALRLSLVCSRWRSVALDIPEMWSYINVSILSHRELAPILMLPEDRGKLQGSDELARCMEAHPVQNVVELYLERSQAHPLDITLYCPSKFESTPEYVVELSPTECVCNHFLLEVYKIFCAHSRRWRTGHINIAHGPQALPREDVYGRWHDDDEMNDVANGYYRCKKKLRVPLLEVLDIYPGPATIKLSKAPRLHTLRVTATPEWCRFPIEKEILKAPALRSLTLRRYDASDLQSILSELAVHSGVDFVFELPHKDRRHAIYANQIHPAPAVKSILVDCSVSQSLRSLDGLLKSLTAPNAIDMEFVLDQRKQATKFPHDLLVGMIKRSTMPLTILKFDGFYMPIEALVDILKLLPTIEVLELGEGPIWELRRTVTKYLDEHGSQVKEAKSEGSQWRNLKIRNPTFVEETFICSKLIRELALSSFLNGSHSVTPLLPNLTSLKLRFRPTCDSQDLKNMVYSRRRDLDLPASNTAQSGLGPEAVRLNWTRSTGGLMSLKLVLILDTLILDNRASSIYDEFEDVIKELKDEGLDAQISSKDYY